jgi:hypothetical protein
LETVYDYSNIVAHLRTFGNWDVYAPPTMKDFPPHWPPACDVRRVQDWLSNNGCPDGVDLLNGACAPMACALGTHACQMLEEGTDPAVVARMGYTSFLGSLGKLGPEAAADSVFTGLKNNGWKTTHKLWNYRIGEDPLYFGTLPVKMHVQKAMEGKHRQVLPLYILCFVFANDELTYADLTKNPVANNAMYEVHAVSIVVDPVSKALLIMDPNGSIMKGSNMDFVTMPMQQKQGTPTTYVSRYDLDQKTLKRGRDKDREREKERERERERERARERERERDKE